jgi:hypothetical protein
MMDTELILVGGSLVRLEAARLKVVTGTDPAAGQEWLVTVPNGKVWRVLAVLVELLTDATVANRAPRLQIDDGNTANRFAVIPSSGLQTASLLNRYEWFSGVGSGWTGSDSASRFAPLPDILLPPGYRLLSTTTNLQAGDNWSAPVLYVAEYDI